MEGIHFVTNEKGKKVAVQIDLERYGELSGKTFTTSLSPLHVPTRRASRSKPSRVASSAASVKLVAEYQITINRQQ